MPDEWYWKVRACWMQATARDFHEDYVRWRDAGKAQQAIDASKCSDACYAVAQFCVSLLCNMN